MAQVERKNTEWGVAPVENSTEGSVSVTLDLLATTADLHVVGEVLSFFHFPHFFPFPFYFSPSP